jgi:hypothetical protein
MQQPIEGRVMGISTSQCRRYEITVHQGEVVLTPEVGFEKKKTAVSYPAYSFSTRSTEQPPKYPQRDPWLEILKENIFPDGSI